MAALRGLAQEIVPAANDRFPPEVGIRRAIAERTNVANSGHKPHFEVFVILPREHSRIEDIPSALDLPASAERSDRPGRLVLMR